MESPNINPININPQAEAIAANSGAIFTAADRKIIKEIAGETNPRKSFKDILMTKPLTQKIDSEKLTTKPVKDIMVAKNQYQEYHIRHKFYQILISIHLNLSKHGQIC